MPNRSDVPPAVGDLARTIAEPKPMRRGTLAKRFLKCNKPGCRCAESEDARHGPYHSIVRVVQGRTRSRHVPAGQVAEARRQVETGQQFRKHLEAYWQACEQWADARLDAAETSSPEAAKKGASKKPLTRKSRPRSKRS